MEGADFHELLFRRVPNPYLELAEIRLELSGENLQRRRLADTVRTDETEHGAQPGRREPMQLEGVGAVAVGGVLVQVAGKVDDLDRSVRAFLKSS